MSKCRTTRKWIRDNYNCVSVGYCGLQYLLHYQDAQFYTYGVYGWNFDAYTFGNYCITTGYRNMICNTEVENVSCFDYDSKARELMENNHDFSTEGYEKLRDKVNALLAEWLEKTFGEKIRVY